MLNTLAARQATQLTDYLRESGFTPSGVQQRIQSDSLPGRHLQNLPLLLYRTRDLDALNVLLRWFIVGEPVPKELAQRLIPSEILGLLAQCGLLDSTGETLASSVMFTPFENLWIATDTYSRLSQGTGVDDVLMINSTTIFLMNLAIRTPCRSLLDLGTGCGVVAVTMSQQVAQQVTATDLSSRSGIFARFNAWLNGRENVEVLTGDLFQPVAGRRFERILSNPPFYITPSSNRMFAENPMELDGFCRNLVKQAPAYLEEGGYLQMLFEWTEIEGQSWQDRLNEWFEGSGCDAVVWHGGSYDPVKYAQIRLPVVVAPAGREADCKNFDSWVEYYQTKKVKSIHAGFLAMRRRSGKNWVHFERVPAEPALPAGDAILHAFAIRDQPLSDELLLTKKLQAIEGLQLRQVMEFRDQHWRPSRDVHMVQTSSLQMVQDLTPEVAEFVSKLDGSTTLGEVVESISLTAGAPREKVQAECISVVKRLLSRGFVRLLI